MSEQPMVSVCIPTRNRAEWLRHAVASVIGQTFADFEIVISNNASSDETAAVVAQFRDPRVQFSSQTESVPMAKNWISAIEPARGKYLAILADDDWWHPEFLARTVSALETDDDAAVAFTDHWLVNQDDALLERDTELAAMQRGRASLREGRVDFIKAALLDQSLLTTSALFRRDVFPDITTLVENGPTLPANYIFGSLALSGYEAVYVPERFAYYRSHPTSATLAATLRTLSDYQWVCDDLISHFSPTGRALKYVEHSRCVAIEDEGALLLRRADWSRARQSYLRLMRIRPWNLRAWLGIGATLPGGRAFYQTMRRPRAVGSTQ
jgi:glycosyltransferase involved in cell wall biosynthesis